MRKFIYHFGPVPKCIKDEIATANGSFPEPPFEIVGFGTWVGTDESQVIHDLDPIDCRGDE